MNSPSTGTWMIICALYVLDERLWHNPNGDTHASDPEWERLNPELLNDGYYFK